MRMCWVDREESKAEVKDSFQGSSSCEGDDDAEACDEIDSCRKRNKIYPEQASKSKDRIRRQEMVGVEG